MSNALSFINVDFDWVERFDNIWRDNEYHVAGVNDDVVAEIMRSTERLAQQKVETSPLGLVLEGPGGSGKTHLLSTVRNEALKAGFNYVAVDLTSVNNFWDTILLNYLQAFDRPHLDGKPQFKCILENLIQMVMKGHSSADALRALAFANGKKLIPFTSKFISALGKIYRREIIQYQDVVRALVYYNSDDLNVSDVGYSWLQGMMLDDACAREFGFRCQQKEPIEIIQAISWLMARKGPTILAIDQIDAIVAEHHQASSWNEEEPSEEAMKSRAIVESITGGLAALVHYATCRTQVVLSCLEETWDHLRHNSLGSNLDRFREPMTLKPLMQEQLCENLIASRLQPAYKTAHYHPPYATFPFAKTALNELKQMFPREILKECEKYRQWCKSEQRVVELTSFIARHQKACGGTTQGDKSLDRAFEANKKRCDVAHYLNPDKADDLGELIRYGLLALSQEQEWGQDVDAVVDNVLWNKNETALFHARLKLIFRNACDRELHFTFRALQCGHSRSFQCRLKAAVTESGIDKKLSFRKLIIVRNEPFPNGVKTAQMIEETKNSGGMFVSITPDEVSTLFALRELFTQVTQDTNGLKDWLKHKKMCHSMALFSSIFEQKMVQESIKLADAGKMNHLTQIRPEAPTGKANLYVVPSAGHLNSEKANIDKNSINQKSVDKNGTEKNSTEKTNADLYESPKKPVTPLGVSPGVVQKEHDEIFIGHALFANTLGKPLTISRQSLQTHTVVIAGSGSGKTVLVRRLIEESALNGIPSIVIDIANDLSRLGDPWPTVPDAWSEEDKQKAERYHANTEVVVWTPGVDSGRPLSIPLLPDLGSVADDPDALRNAIEIARNALIKIVANRNTQSTRLKESVLNSALMCFAEHRGGGGLSEFIDVLSDLPPEASTISNARRMASEMADALRAELELNPLLVPGKNVLDPAELLGIGADKTRISVINLAGLASLENQLSFVNNLCSHLYVWLKKNPGNMRGLFVFDEAKEFIPSGRSTATKETLQRFAAQGRKYGIGMVFATQMPRSIDHHITGNCKNQFYGRSASPAAIATIKQLIQERGGHGEDIGKLERGVFYAATEMVSKPCKIKTPMCLSYHPATPLTEAEVIQRAQLSPKSYVK